jgi:dihydrofolate reductase/uncharacterized protein YhbP (UPF0306 family)
MSKVIADISMSLDGFVTGLDPGPDNGMGVGGEALHAWAFSDDPDDRRILRDSTARAGAVVLGRRLFDVVDGPDGWNDETGYGAGEVGKPAFVVVTSSPPESVRLTDLDWTFVTTGLSDAITAARGRAEAAVTASGRDLDVVLMGGGATVGSALDAGLVDVLMLHLAPVVLGAGTPLFTGGMPRNLVQRSVTSTSNATHLTYDVLDATPPDGTSPATPQDTARRIIGTNHYLTLATADRDGRPWASPVYYTPDGGSDFYWVSRPDSRHSRNLAERPEVGIVIFDSQVPLFTGEAVYLTAHAEQVGELDLERCTEIFRSRLPELGSFGPERLRAPGPFRLYRAHALEASVIVRDGPDIRVPIEVPV